MGDPWEYSNLKLSTREPSELLTSLLTSPRTTVLSLSLEEETLLLLASSPDVLVRCPTSPPEVVLPSSFLRARFFPELLLLLTNKLIEPAIQSSRQTEQRVFIN